VSWIGAIAVCPVKEMEIRSLGDWNAVILGTAVQTKGISNAAAKGSSRDPPGATERYGFSPSSIDVKPRHGLPGFTHGGKLIRSMIASFDK
jgi:hypothetical protein